MMSKDVIYREDAIKAINLRARIPHDIASAHYANMAINAIRSVPSADRPQNVIAQITFDEEKLREIVEEAVERFKEEYEITDIPQGEWYQIKDHKVMGEGYLWHCSLCGNRVYQDSSADYPTENYCSNCGADMKKGADDETDNI